MRKILLIIMIGIICQACASTMWVKNGATEESFRADVAQCEYQAALATGSYNPNSPGDPIASGISDGIARGMRKNELTKMCMRTRGYVQQRK